MTIPPGLAAELTLLTQALDLPGADLAETLTRLAADARAAVGSYLGLSIAITADHGTFDCTLLDESAEPEDVRTSLLVPLSAPAPESAVDRTTSSAAVALVLYASAPGAFVDLAADLVWITGLDPAEVLLDGHLTVPARQTRRSHVVEASAVNQALGVLIGDGATPEQAERDLGERASAAGLDLPSAALLVLATLPPSPPENPTCDA